MPIPTDTFWNIKRLNVVFAASAVALLGVTAWAILQDYSGLWRVPQRQARVWEAALVDQKISRELTPDLEKRLAALQDQIAAAQSNLETHDANYAKLIDERRKIDGEKSTLEFKLSNTKSTLQVLEAHLQDAVAANDQERINSITAELEAPRKTVAAGNEQMAQYALELARIRDALAKETAALDALTKERNRLSTDIESAKKKLELLAPGSLLGKVSSIVRDAPLLGFVNPAEKVQQIVLPDVQTDVAFMKITTVDRCTTCHINIAKKEFTEDAIIAYLEEQVATARRLKLPEKAGTRPTDPSATITKPGSAAAVEFWHGWARELAPALVAKNAARINAVARNAGTGKPITIKYDGADVAELKFDAALTDSVAARRQSDLVLAVMDALYRWEKGADTTAARGLAVATIAGAADERAVTTARNLALRYPEELYNGLKSSTPANTLALLTDRYRTYLTSELNIARKQQGLPLLDHSPVVLAHPRLDLYVDIDSPHSLEAVGCTSCHDGSGQETDFVLTAHKARDILVDAKTGVPVLSSQLEQEPPAHDAAHDLSNMLEAAQHAHGLHLATVPTSQPASHTGPAPAIAAYVDPVTGAQGQAIPQLQYWKKIYEPKAPRKFELVYHEWDWPMRTPDFIQVNCARCHTEVYDIKETAPVLYEGRQLFTQMGCVNCHQMDSIPAAQNRKVGTDLRHVTAKLSPEFINTWIWAPKAFRPTTKMPHFFMLENNSSNEELRRTRQEALAMTEYLVRTASPLRPGHLVPQGSQGSAEAGKVLFNTLGCLACHQNLNERGEEWITTDLVKRAGTTAEDAKAAYTKMSYNERHLYVQQHLAEPAGHNEVATYADGSPKPVFVQVGPELSAIGTKLTAGRSTEQAAQWLFDWLKEPRHYSEYTFMPSLRLSDQETLDLMAYLLSQQRTTTDPSDKWAAGLTPADTDKLIELTALQLRNRYSVATSVVKAKDEAELTALAVDALTTPVSSPEQAKAVAATMTADQKRLVFLGKKMIAHYGCMSCHSINGMETATSPCTNLSDWGQKGVDKLDFGYVDHHKVEDFHRAGVMTRPIPMVNALSAEASKLGHEPIGGELLAHDFAATWPHLQHNRDSWLQQKLSNSRIFDRAKTLLEPSRDDPGKPYDKLKMPTFYLNEEQIHAITTFVLSNRNRLVSATLTAKATHPQAIQIARGRELTERYNCVACHQVEHNQPQVQQYYKREEVITKAPPSLRGEGNKIQFNWAFNFFKHVEPLRPLLAQGIRMPSFPATDDEWTAIIAYFNSVSNKESKQLAKWVDAIEKYTESARAATSQPATNPAEAQPGDDWYLRRQFAVAAQALRDWGLQYGHIKPIEIGPLASAEDLRKVHKTLLFKAKFTRQLYDSPYPFVDAPRPQLTDAQFKLGESLFYEMQCLKCHVLGDPNIDGANKAPTAPNLTLTHERLQRRWVRHWVQEPNIIQVGTAMPPFVTGLPIFNLEGQPWPKSQGVAEAEVHRVEAKYGDTVPEQTDLVLDFLYAAGVRGYTGVQPPTAAPASQPAN